MTAIQGIFIRGHEERSSPKSHTVYRIEVQAHVQSWQVWKRYSEFDDLHTELTKSTGSAPPCPLPPKHPFSILRSRLDPKDLEERRLGLEAYLRAILSAKDDKWREHYAFKEFIGEQSGRGLASGSSALAGGPTGLHFTPSTWLDEHAELQTRLRDVWADINKRDALSDRGDISEAHQSNAGAKKKLAGVLARIGALGQALERLGLEGLSEGELQRRTDMVARLQDDCEKLSKVVSVARQTGLGGLGGAGGKLVGKGIASDSDRAALLGPQAVASKPVRRVFGAPPQETEATRPLDNVGLMASQQVQIEHQDQQLSQLTTILRRQRQLGEAINQEALEQLELIDGLNNDVDRVGQKLQSAKQQLNRIS